MSAKRPTLPILFRDERLVAVDKPSGLLVHRGGWGNDRVVAMTLVRDQLGRHVFPLHRLDRATSGVLLFALSSEEAALLCPLFEQGLIEKRYVALVRGVPPAEGLIDSPVPGSPSGQRLPAVTRFRLLSALENLSGRFSLVEAIPLTGRLHQIRRHLKHLGHPLIGDVNYGKGDLNRLFRERYGLRRLALHACSAAFAHPATGERIFAKAPLPEDLAGPLLALGVPAAVLEPLGHGAAGGPR